MLSTRRFGGDRGNSSFRSHSERGPRNSLPQLDNRSFNYRVPPAWAPELGYSGEYTYQCWCRDIMHWTMLTDLTPAQQAASIVMRLGGAARDLARTITATEIRTGGVIDTPG